MSIVRIRESILKKIYENFVGTLETVHNIEVSVLEKCPYNCSLVGEREIHLCCVYVLHKNFMEDVNTARNDHAWLTSNAHRDMII